MKSYNIHFIRHGLTQANINGQYAGVWDIPVCQEGEEKLKALKNEFEYPLVQEYYSSPLSRCIQTCNIVYPESAVIPVEGLKEWDFGKWEGKTTKELLNDPCYVSWVENGRQSSPPQGESALEFGARVKTAFESIVESLMKRKITEAAIFTHGGVMMNILSVYGFPRAKFLDWISDNGCGYSVRITPSLWSRSKVFEVYDKLPYGCKKEINGNFKDLIDNLK